MGNLTFVIADDAMFMRSLLRRMIEENQHYSVVGEAANGNEAIEHARNLKPDIMILDITMPEKDGLEAIEEILKVSPNTKIIMVSAMGEQSLVMEAIKMGAKDFIIKPFDKYRVLEAIKNATLA